MSTAKIGTAFGSTPQQSTHPSINYTWIGPPAIQSSSTGIPGQDLAGPIEMAKVNKDNPITFWCLEEHEKHYQDKLGEYKNIQVRSMESHMKETLKSRDPDIRATAKDVQKIIDTSLKADKRGTIRDRVTVKDAFTLFLLHTKGGYTLDTNILPSKEQKQITLPSFDTMRIPAFKDKPQSSYDIDCWMMFSPPGNEFVTKKALSGYFDLWKKAEKLHSLKRGPTAVYDETLGYAATEPLFNLLQTKEAKPWQAVMSKDELTASIPELGVDKTYGNTHKFDREFKESAMLDMTFRGHATMLQQQILHGGNVNERIEKPYKDFHEGETLLHIAIRRGHVDCVRILLEAKADVSLKANYNGNLVSAQDLMMQPKYKDKYKDFHISTDAPEKSDHIRPASKL